MFRHTEYVESVDYPYNAGYVIYSNYFFPILDNGETASSPMKEFPKFFKENFEYFVDNELNRQERDIIYKTFKEKKNYNDIVKEMGMSNKAFTAARTRVFVKLRNMSRSNVILSDEKYIPKSKNVSVITLGDIVVDSVIKSPDAITGGGDFRLISVKKGKFPMFTVRVSSKLSSQMLEEDVNDFVNEVAKLAEKIKLRE